MEDDFIARNLFSDLGGYEFVLPWPSFVSALKDFLQRTLKTRGENGLFMIGTSKVINSVIEPGALIGDFSLIRNSIIESGARIGAHVQLNMSIIMRGTELTHFNNVAYSLLGRDVLFGVAATTSSRRLDGGSPFIHLPNGNQLVSQTDKFGSLVGDGCRIGSHVCLNPFTVIEKGMIVPPGRSISGYVGRSTTT